MVLNDKQLEMCESSRWDFSDLKALFWEDCRVVSQRQPDEQEWLDLIGQG